MATPPAGASHACGVRKFGRAHATVAAAAEREPGRGDAANYDPAGGLTVTGALILLVYALVEAPDVGWSSARTILVLVGSVVLLGAFGLIESRHPARWCRSASYARTLVGANTVLLLAGTLAIAIPFALTLYAQQVLGYSAVKFGVGSVVLVVGAVAAQAAVLKVGVRPVAATGMALMGVGRQFSRTSP